MSYCYWRLNNLQKSILCIHSAKRFDGCQDHGPRSKVPQATVPQINTHFRNLVVKEMKLDIVKAVAVYEARRRNSHPGSSAERMKLQYSPPRRAATVIACAQDSDISDEDKDQKGRVEEAQSVASPDDSQEDSTPSSSSRTSSNLVTTENKHQQTGPEAAANSPK